MNKASLIIGLDMRLRVHYALILRHFFLALHTSPQKIERKNVCCMRDTNCNSFRTAALQQFISFYLEIYDEALHLKECSSKSPKWILYSSHCIPSSLQVWQFFMAKNEGWALKMWESATMYLMVTPLQLFQKSRP